MEKDTDLNIVIELNNEMPKEQIDDFINRMIRSVTTEQLLNIKSVKLVKTMLEVSIEAFPEHKNETKPE